MEAPPPEHGRPGHGQYGQQQDRTQWFEVVWNEVNAQREDHDRCHDADPKTKAQLKRNNEHDPWPLDGEGSQQEKPEGDGERKNGIVHGVILALAREPENAAGA